MTNPSEVKEQHHPGMKKCGRERMHLMGARHGSPGMTWNCFQRSADTGPQSHPFKTGVALTPWEKRTTSFLSFDFDCSVFVCSRPSSLQSLGVFDSVAPVHCISCLLRLEESHLVLPSTHLSDDTQLDVATWFDSCAACSHSFPAQTYTASFSWGGCSFQALKSHWVLWFYVIYHSACLQVSTDSDIHF